MSQILLSPVNPQPTLENCRVKWIVWRWLSDWLGAIGLAAMLTFAGFIGFWIWARDDFFPQQLMLSAPPQSANRVAVTSDFNFQGDGWHSFSVSENGKRKWRNWTNLETIPYLRDQNYRLIWSRDGSLVALKQSLTSAAFDFAKRKKYESDAWPNPNAFSRHLDAMMKARGGAVSSREIRRDVGVWRWQDRELKDAR